MTRYAIDAPTALRFVREAAVLDPADSLVGPAVLRSHALSILYREMRAGGLPEKEGRAQLEGLAAVKIRLLGDRVSRATAWRLAAQLDWDDTALAEYLAVAVLQADVLVTDDEELVAAARGLIPVAGSAALIARD